MRRLTLLTVAFALAAFGCNTTHEIEVKPTEHRIKVDPIQITVDVNVKVEVEKELEDVFDFREDLSGGGV